MLAVILMGKAAPGVVGTLVKWAVPLFRWAAEVALGASSAATVSGMGWLRAVCPLLKDRVMLRVVSLLAGAGKKLAQSAWARMQVPKPVAGFRLLPAAVQEVLESLCTSLTSAMVVEAALRLMAGRSTKATSRRHPTSWWMVGVLRKAWRCSTGTSAKGGGAGTLVGDW